MAVEREAVRARLHALGFDEVRFARVESGFGPRLSDWIAAGYHAEMNWMERSVPKRSDPTLVQPGARSVIMLGVNYLPPTSAVQVGGGDAPKGGAERVGDDAEGGSSRVRPAWARYALYDDYHDTIKAALVDAGKVLEELGAVTAADYRYYVDTGPVIERGWAAKSGLGFIGKNGMLISRRHGNWLFLAAVLTTLEFEPDEPVRKEAAGRELEPGLLCGKCTRCMDACPTQALPAPGVVDARRCVSYQTIENKGIIPRELRVGIGQRIYGCDTCLEVCPWNRFAQAGRQVLLAARYGLADMPLHEVLELTPERFAAVFKGTAIKRVKLAGLLRNACIVAANTGALDCLESLVALAGHTSPVVRAHAVWAVRRMGGVERLREFQAVEADVSVLAEYSGAV
ncbi:MAG: tRNA epoxyqueuosine(34) reductase QueG [Opitutus sp.]|nr:tRNA epoxyqueuosine(34) reductase QueG [Opitutus sp.]MCS6247145.1 tRNA epoxyqueuosine(34) reductase QueG [Opitutus sp.]MCS6273547.1 tRNA epoxyqueuosine(34) reductase QueG [Opitutus sp.]MCS6299889.1 tRNA epoxyqueuosine(34) reductase QueG [Opitutus sp.]